MSRLAGKILLVTYGARSSTGAEFIADSELAGLIRQVGAPVGKAVSAWR